MTAAFTGYDNGNFTAQIMNYTTQQGVGVVIGYSTSITNGNSIMLTVKSIKTGTFDLSDNSVAGASISKLVNGTPTYTMAAVKGTLTLSKASTSEIEGTFSFTAQAFTTADSIVVTNGKFYCKSGLGL